MSPPSSILTPRLLLRKPVAEDAKEVTEAYAHDADVTRFLTWRPDQTPEEIAAFVERARLGWEQGTAFTWSILLKETRALIGMIDARVDAYMLNVGYVLARGHWNKGYATEALRAVIEWSDREGEIYRVWAVCAVDNPASARVMEKAGMQREGILRRWMVFPNIGGAPLDCYCYARVKDAQGSG
ncbi:MAG: GNAT family N-acetyltransferase [Bacteroidota bacterium]